MGLFADNRISVAGCPFCDEDLAAQRAPVAGPTPEDLAILVVDAHPNIVPDQPMIRSAEPCSPATTFGMPAGRPTRR
jgi:hypothetical protein